MFQDKMMSETFSFEADPPQDFIDHVVRIEEGSWLDILRRGRSILRDNAQKSLELLLNPKQENGFSRLERLSVASFVAGLHGEVRIYHVYLDLLRQAAGGADLWGQIARLVTQGRTVGPYGAYPHGPLSGEDLNGLTFDHAGCELDSRLAAALTHAHLLVYHPRDASSAALEALKAAGWSDTAIVTLSQLVSFLTFQIRMVHGLRVLSKAGPNPVESLHE